MEESSQWDGNYYKDHSQMQFKVAKEALENFPFPPEAKILDIGCGDGKITKYISEMLPDSTVVGVDRSSSMLSIAKTHTSKRLSFMQAEATALPFDAEFDCIVSFNCLHWVKEIEIALQQINKALRPGGRTCLVMAPQQTRYPLRTVIEKTASLEKWRPYFGKNTLVFTRHSFAKWATLTEESGLIPENLQLVDGSIDYPNKTAFAHWIAGWIPFGTIPNDKKDEYLSDIVDAYTAIHPCKANGILPFHLDELKIVSLRIKATPSRR